MPLTLPEIPEAENTSLVRQLLEIIRTQQDRIQQLEDEILRLKGLKTRPVIAPSPLERPPRPPREPGQKRPGSAKRSKTAQLVITHEVVVPLADVPPGSAFKGYEDFVVQDLEIRPRVTRYRRERWRSPDGRNLVAPLPEGVRPESHFGSTLISFIIHQYHYQHVTQPLLLEQLDQLGIDISAGQLNGILTEKKQRPDTGLKAPPALGGSAMVVRLTGRQIFAVNGTAPARHDRRAEPGHSTSEMIQEDMKIL